MSSNRRPRKFQRSKPMAMPMALRQQPRNPPPAVWSCPRPAPARFTRRPFWLPTSLCQAPETRPPALAFSAASPSLIAGPAAARAVVRAAIRNAPLARVPDPQANSDPPASSPAVHGPSTQPAPPLAATLVRPDQAQARVQALARVPAWVDRPVQALARVLAPVAQLRPPVRRHVRSAPQTNAPAAAPRSTPRPRKAQ